MKFSSKIEKCGLSPMRKFAPYANEAAKKGKKLYHLNIGQPDIATPEAYFEAVKSFSHPPDHHNAGGELQVRHP